MSAHDHLLDQLRDSVRARARRGLLLSLAGAVVVGGGVATAATGVLPVVGHDDGGGTAAGLASRAVRATLHEPACALTDADTPVRAVRVEPARAARPLLAGTAPDAAAQRALLARRYVGSIVDGSVRRVALPGGRRVLVFLALGAGPLSFRDPGACLSARLAWLAAHASGERRARAEAIVRGYRDTIPGLQSLNIMTLRAGPGLAGPGTGIPLDGRPLPTGVVSGGSDGISTGIAVPGARRVTVDGRHGPHRSFAVRHRIFVVALPAKGTGPVRLRQRAADGRVLAGQTLRG
ncbi:MAG TPA: hypothetical protein VFG42_02575 [Baekduia sp.]|uniref:hypothetical protein n=1 Tax=Baekduia sp. TaxID=2600305 RepID=UPI002D7700F1|nr:hypothetical protein [Baekduia sp.]HET6505652.1 hypothetical protein [Baekduia sp.]